MRLDGAGRAAAFRRNQERGESGSRVSGRLVLVSKEGGVVFGGGGVRDLARGVPLRGVPEEQQREGVLQGAHAGRLRGAVDDPGLLIYERVLPALAGSVARIPPRTD
jgi:hypothetical protein